MSEDAPATAPAGSPAPATPRAGRGLVAEIAIIVVGVLIALSADQGVQWLNWRSQVADARQALRDELGHNIVSMRKRLSLAPCIDRRIASLNDVLARRTAQLSGPIGRPLSTNMQDTVWHVMTSGDVSAQLPLDERLRYAQLYAGLQTLNNIQVRERDIWAELQQFQEADASDAATRMRLRGLIAQARWINAAIGVTARDALAKAGEIGATPQQMTPIDTARLEGLCGPPGAAG